MQQQSRLTAVQVRTGQKIRANHLETVAARFIAAEHQSRGLDRLLDDWELALVEFEVDNLPRFGVLSRQLLLDLSLEFFFRQNLGLVQPGCTIELLTITSSR